MYISLARFDGSKDQQWDIVYTNQYGNKDKGGEMTPVDATTDGCWLSAPKMMLFSITSNTGKALYIDLKDGNKVKARKPLGNPEEVFYCDQEKRAVIWMGDEKMSLAVKKDQIQSFNVVGHPTSGTAPEWFQQVSP